MKKNKFIRILCASQGDKVKAIGKKIVFTGIISDICYDKNNQFTGYMLYLPSNELDKGGTEFFISKNDYLIQKLLF